MKVGTDQKREVSEIEAEVDRMGLPDVEIDQEGFKKEFRPLWVQHIFISRQKAPLDTELARLTECRKLLVKLCDKLSDKSYELHFELGDISRKMDDLQNEHSPKLAEAMRRLDEKASEEWHLAFRALERAHGSPADKCHRRHHKPREPRNCTMDQWQ